MNGSLSHVEGDVVDRDEPAERLRQSLDLEDRRPGAVGDCSRCLELLDVGQVHRLEAAACREGGFCRHHLGRTPYAADQRRRMGQDPVDHARDAAGHRERDEEDDQPENGVPEGSPLDDPIEDEEVEEGADERAEEVARASDEDGNQCECRSLPVELPRVDLRLADHGEPARDRCKGRRDHESSHFVALDPEPGELCPTAVLADAT